MKSCTHPECARVQNMAASLFSTVADDTVIDLARTQPDRQAWSLICLDDANRPGQPSACTYLYDNGSGEWFAARVTRVTDPDLIAKLETAAAGSAPSLTDLGMSQEQAARIDEFLGNPASGSGSGVRRSRPEREVTE